VREDARVRGEVEQAAKLGTRRKAEGCRREWKGAQGVRYLTSPFLCPWPSLASDSLFSCSKVNGGIFPSFSSPCCCYLCVPRTYTCMQARTHVRTYMYTYSQTFLVALSARSLFLFSFCCSFSIIPHVSYHVSLTCSIRENRYCFIIPRVVAICELRLDPSIHCLPHLSLSPSLSVFCFVPCCFFHRVPRFLRDIEISL